MVSSDGLPPALQDRVVEAYDMPMVGRVEIRQDPQTNQYNGWVSAQGIVHSPNPGDLDATRKIVGEFVVKIATTFYDKAKRDFDAEKTRFDNVQREYSDLSLHAEEVQRTSGDARDWMRRYISR